MNSNSLHTDDVDLGVSRLKDRDGRPEWLAELVGPPALPYPHRQGKLSSTAPAGPLW